VTDILQQLRRRYETEPYERLERSMAFIERFRDGVQNAASKARGWPVSSGEIDSVQRQVGNDQ
jgi:hypothetical protein